MGCAGGKEKPVVKSANAAPSKPAEAKSFGPFKVVPMGDFTVGKTSLIIRETTGHFPEEANKDWKEKVEKAYTVSAGTVKLAFHDTAGQEQYSVVTSSIYQGSHCQVIVYDVSSPESFTQISSHLEQGKQYSSQSTIPSPVRVLIGNKSDLEEKVDRSEAEQFAKEHDMLFAVVSAKTGQGLTEIFTQVAEELAKTKFDM